MTHFVRSVKPSPERRIARKTLLDAMLSHVEPWSCISCSSVAQDVHSMTFQSSSLHDILATSTSPPPKLPIATLNSSSSFRRASTGSVFSSHADEQASESLPDACRAWSKLAKRFNLPRPA
ncbi:hypothetical protein T484DRAFT_1742478 [Baffinella frigidus]|nr:hypothetical protein T484DRAFT_1742478 [Cryptophyta sp. CCMP2293]